MKLGNNIASLFSFLLHPFLITFYCIALLYTYTTYFEYTQNALAVSITTFLFSAIIPFIFLLLLKQLKLIKSYMPNTKEERILPFFMAILANIFLLYYFYKSSNVYIWVLGLIAAPTLSMLVALITNFFWKISIHAVGIGALIGSTFSMCYNVKGLNPFVLFIILFILAGCLGVSRLFLKKESPAQVYIGFIAGFFVSFFSVWLSILLIAIYSV